MPQFVYRFVVVTYDSHWVPVSDGGIADRIEALEKSMLAGGWSFATESRRIRTKNGQDIYFLEREISADCNPSVRQDVIHLLVSPTSIQEIRR